MLKEKHPLLKDFKEEKIDIFQFFKNIFEAFYNLFDIILENPIENFWYECIGIIISYVQILLYLFDKTVSK